MFYYIAGGNANQTPCQRLAREKQNSGEMIFTRNRCALLEYGARYVYGICLHGSTSYVIIFSDIYFYLVIVAPVSEYRTSNVEKKQCKHAVCLCDMEMVRCMTHYQNEINLKKINHQRCNLPGNIFICLVTILVFEK